MSTVYGDLASDGVVSTKISGEDIFVLSSVARLGEEDARDVELFASEEKWRVLHLDDVVRSSSGLVRRGRLAGVVSSGLDADLGAIYRRVLRRDVLSTSELSRFRASGYFGGTGRLASESLVCHCLGLSRQAVLEAAPPKEDRYGAVRRSTGAGVVCGGCLPVLRELLETSAAGAREEASSALDREALETRARVTGEPVPPRLTVREFESRYDPEPLSAIRGDHAVHLIALGSLFAGCGERFMIGAMLRAAPELCDPELTSDLEVFLQQESNHVSAHEPLNRLLAERIYADCPRLRAMQRLAFTRLERASPELQLAVCAAFEFVADCFFELHFEEVIEGGGLHHPDGEVEERLEASGVLGLFQWHGIEELGHRHVAFDVMKSRSPGYATRIAGMLWTLWELTRIATRVLPQLWWKTARGRRRGYLRSAIHRPGLLRRLPRRLLSYFAPGFHPRAIPCPLLGELEKRYLS